jgi:hypothetical protein
MYRDSTARANTASAEPATSVQFLNFQRAYMEATSAKWPMNVLAKLTSLLELKPGWDSYNAASPRHDAAMFAAVVLQNVMTPGTPEPSVLPSSSGGIQLEWHDKGIDLEIHVVAPYTGEVWWFDHNTGVERTEDLGTNFSFLYDPISKLSV